MPLHGQRLTLPRWMPAERIIAPEPSLFNILPGDWLKQGDESGK